jgi:hypothetical protein
MLEESQGDESMGTAAQTETTSLDSPSANSLNEDLALSELKNRDLSPEFIEEISRNNCLMKSRKVRIAIALHPRTARHIALRLIRELYTFELLQFALMPSAAADLKLVADELLISRLASVSLGERISLARRSSEMVAAALLLDNEKRVWQPALENPRMTEVAIVRALQRTRGTPAFVQAVSHHPKWSLRPEIRVALLRNAHTPFARALEFARRIAAPQMRDILRSSRLPEKTKQYLRRSIEGPGRTEK